MNVAGLAVRTENAVTKQSAARIWERTSLEHHCTAPDMESWLPFFKGNEESGIYRN